MTLKNNWVEKDTPGHTENDWTFTATDQNDVATQVNSNTTNIAAKYTKPPSGIPNSDMADDAIGIAELSATGTPSSSTFLRGDNTWDVPSVGTVADNSITNAKMADDAVGIAELSATGTPSSSTFLCGDNTWGTPAGDGAATALPSLFVAASTAATEQKALADYICDGTADQVQINAALAALPGSKGTVVLSSGTFSTTAAINVGDSQRLVGQGIDSTIIMGASTTFHVIHMGNRQATGVMSNFMVLKDLSVSSAGGANSYDTVWADGMGIGSSIQNVKSSEGKYNFRLTDLDQCSVSNIKGYNPRTASIYLEVGLENTWGNVALYSPSMALSDNNSACLLVDANANQSSANRIDRVSIYGALFYSSVGRTGTAGLRFNVGATSFAVIGSLSENPVTHVELNDQTQLVWESSSMIQNSGVSTNGFLCANDNHSITVISSRFQQCTNLFNGASGYTKICMLGFSENQGNISNLFTGSFGAKTGTDVQFVGDGVLASGLDNERYDWVMANKLRLHDGTPTAGKVLTATDTNGNCTWNMPGGLNGIINVQSYGATGDGVTDDSAAIQDAVADLADNTAIYFPPGIYRFADTTPAGGGAVVVNGLDNVSVLFDPGAELLMDNLSSGDGTGPAVFVKGAASNIWVENARVRWASTPNRSNGDGFRFVGYPSDSAPPGGWAGSTGKLQNLHLINCTAVNTPQTGAVFMGCSDIRVVNFRAESTKADALHFNACRRVNVLGHTAVSPGDDGLAFVTYYHASTIWQDANNGPFNQPSLGAWNNTDSQAFGFVGYGGSTNGIRVAGALNVTFGSISLAHFASDSGIKIDAAIANGSSILWTYLASVGIVISNAKLTACNQGVQVITQNITSASNSMYWLFGVMFSNVDVSECTNWSFITQGDGSESSVVGGVSIDGLRVVTGSGDNGVKFSSLRKANINNVWMNTTTGVGIIIQGQDAALSGAVSTLPRHEVVLQDIHCNGGRILLQDLNTVTGGQFWGCNSPGDGIDLVRVINVDLVDLHVLLANRGNTGTVRGLFCQKVVNINLSAVFIEHDANITTSWSSLEIGGGDATDIAASNLIIHRLIYRNTINGSNSDVTLQGGPYAPIRYGYWIAHYNGGESTPIWRTSMGGAIALLGPRGPRVGTTTSAATPTIDTDSYDMYGLTAQTEAITNFTTNLSGTPVDGQKLWIYIVGTAARAITWGTKFENGAETLPTTTVTTERLDVGFIWNSVSQKWRCMAYGSAA